MQDLVACLGVYRGLSFKTFGLGFRVLSGGLGFRGTRADQQSLGSKTWESGLSALQGLGV